MYTFSMNNWINAIHRLLRRCVTQVCIILMASLQVLKSSDERLKHMNTAVKELGLYEGDLKKFTTWLGKVEREMKRSEGTDKLEDVQWLKTAHTVCLTCDMISSLSKLL